MNLRSWLTAPDPTRAVHFADDADGWIRHPYPAVADRARRIATLLRSNGFRVGDGACVILPTGVDAVAAFFATWVAGGSFTPIAPPLFDDLDTYRDHLAGLLTAAAPRVVVTESDYAELVIAAMRAAGRDDDPLVLEPGLLDGVEPAEVSPDAGDVCLVQFTSGSTGAPRGVRIGWDNLADNIGRIVDVIGWRDGDATAGWLPLYHDMGLVGVLLMTVVRQGDLYLMRPDQFVRDPARWLRAMTQAQHSAAPAFALEYVARRVTDADVTSLDLSGWRTLVLGAEPVPPAAVVTFATRLAPAKFDLAAVTVAYGLAENTLFVSSSSRVQPVTAIRVDPADLVAGAHVGVLERHSLVVGTELVGAGWLSGVGSAAGITIVDDDGVPVPDGVLGEIDITGDSVALGYIGDEGTGTTVTDGHLRTGDAGFRYGGELFVLGRIGTSLKVRGRTVFMETVDARVAAETGIAPGRIAAVAVPDGPDTIVALFAECEPGDWEEAAIRAAAAVSGTPVRVVTGPRGLIPRTSSGKPRRRAMAASPLVSGLGVHGLLNRARAPKAHETVLLEGSIAEGFGNAGSDVDFLVVTPGDEHTPTMPTVLFIDGRRVEVRTRSATQLRAQLERVRAGEANEDVLNRVQRFLNARVVHAGEVDVAALREIVPADLFATTMRDWWSRRAVQALQYATAFEVLGEHDEALGWARDGLDQAMKAWAASRGETYLESKWLPHQLDRIGAADEIDHYRTVDRNDVDALAAVAVRLFGSSGDATGARGLTREIRLRRMPGVTTWPIGDRVHVLRDKSDMFVLSERAAQAWRGVVFGRPITETPAAERRLLAEFVRLGFVGLRSATGEPITPALAMCDVVRPFTPAPSRGTPLLGTDGAHRDDTDITLSPLPATRFAECALTLVWSQIVAENAREDLEGAVKDEQWPVATIAAHRALAMHVRVLLSSYGIHPLPADVAPVATVRRLVPAAEGLVDLIAAADAVRITDAESTAAATAVLDMLRDAIDGARFPTSFASRRQWRATLDIGYDWLRLGGYLNSALPLDEARDLLESGGMQPEEQGDR